MSTRQTKWISPIEIKGYAIHLYREMLDGKLWVDISKGYGFAFCLSKPWIWRH